MLKTIVVPALSLLALIPSMSLAVTPVEPPHSTWRVLWTNQTTHIVESATFIKNDGSPGLLRSTDDYAAIWRTRPANQVVVTGSMKIDADYSDSTFFGTSSNLSNGDSCTITRQLMGLQAVGTFECADGGKGILTAVLTR